MIINSRDYEAHYEAITDDVRRIRCHFSLGDFDMMPDPFFGIEVIAVQSREYVKFASSQPRLCLVFGGHITRFTEASEEAFAPGEMFISDPRSPHLISRRPDELGSDAFIVSVPIIPGVARKIYPLLDLLASGTDIAPFLGGTVGAEIWRYYFVVGLESSTENSRRSSIIQRIYLQAILNYGIEKKDILSSELDYNEPAYISANQIQHTVVNRSTHPVSIKNCERNDVSTIRRFQRKIGMTPKQYERRVKKVMSKYF